MILIYKDGVYTMHAEHEDRAELIKELALCIHQLSHNDVSGDYKAPTFDTGVGAPEYS